MDGMERTIIKLNKVVRLGYVPSRGLQPYFFSTAKVVNCLEHAIFNFTNKQIKFAGLNSEDKSSFGNFYRDYSDENLVTDLKYFVRQTGLKIEECDYKDELSPLEQKVALYLRSELYNQDFHFYRLEKQQKGKELWTGKASFTSKVQKEKYLDMTMDGQVFYGCYKITNPNVDREK